MTNNIWAMPSARATHASHRARILGLGLSVGIAIAVSGCERSLPSFHREKTTAEYLHDIPKGWEPMDTAPHNGTVVEVRGDGETIDYGLYEWVEGRGWTQVSCGPGGPEESPTLGLSGNGTLIDGPWFSWRPYSGKLENYVSPAAADHDIYYDKARHRCWSTFWPKPGTKEARAIEMRADRKAKIPLKEWR